MSRNARRATESTPTTDNNPVGVAVGVSAEVKDMVGVIFRPYGRKSSVTIRHFPSLRTEVYTHI